MKVFSSIKRLRPRTAIIGLLLIVVVLLGISFVYVYQKNDYSVSAADTGSDLRTNIKNGIGKEVQLANVASSSEEINESVQSVADFIKKRSNLGMSAETRERLGAMEQTALRNNRRISLDDLSNALAHSITEKLATWSDGEMVSAVKSLNKNGTEVSLRANGDYRLSKEEFVREAQILRTQLATNKEVGVRAVQGLIAKELNTRIEILNEAVPEQFGNATQEGLTPLQSMILVYSVMTDDNLAYSESDLKIITKQATQDFAKNNPQDPRAFGPNGQVFSSPSQLFFNREMIVSFLDRLENGGNRNEK